ncbi:MAG: AAA family ATPase [Gammaproteobacteria bacterium]
MRILNISFKNINSLKGEGRIDFDRGPIADSGVFAITGPNGSGKSSILDVITLGLYGETFRFDKPAAHVMTKQTHECYAQVEFALGDEKFRSYWEVKTDTSMTPPIPALPNMKLFRVSGEEELLADTPNQVRVRIAELTGMDFHRFGQSVVLSQGNFAAFLNALDSERMDILEKICGANLYNDYRRQTEERFTESKTRLTELQQDIAGLPILEESALEAAIHDLQDFKDQVAEFQQQRQVIDHDLITVQNVAALQEKQTQLRRKRQDLLVQIAHAQNNLERIANAQDALAFRGEITLLDKKHSEIEENQRTLDSYRKELEQLQAQLGSEVGATPPPLPNKNLAEQKQIVDSLKLTLSELKLELPRQRELAQSIRQQISNNQASLTELDAWLTTHQSDAMLVDNFPDVVRLRNVRNELIELGKKKKSNANWIRDTENSLKKNKAALEDTQTDLAEVKSQIEKDNATLDQIAQGKSFDELKELQQEQQSRVSDLQEMFALASVTAKLTSKGWFSWLGIKKQSDIPPDITQLQSRLAELSEELSREQNIIKVLEQALRNEALIKKMTADRTKLVDGQPCYLCGSTTHPYALKPPVFTDAKKALVDQRGKIQNLKARVDQATAELKSAQKFDSKQSEKQQRLHQMHSQWTTLANRLNIAHERLEIGDISKQKQRLAEEIEELNKINDLVKRHAQLQRGVAKMKAEVESKQASLKTLSKTVEALTAKWDSRPQDLDDTEKLFAERSAEESNLTEKLKVQLSTLGEKLPGRGKENALFDRLNSRRQDYQVYLLRQQGLQKEITTLNEKLLNCESKINDFQHQTTEKLESLSREEQLTLHLAVIEKQKLISEKEQQLRILQIELRTITQTLDEKIANTSFESVDALRSLLHLVDQEPQIRQQLDDLRASLAHADEQLQSCSSELETGQAATTELSLDDIQRSLSDIDGKIDIAEQEIKTLENKISKQQQYRERLQGLQAKQDEQQQLFEQAEADLKLIDGDPAGFRKHIQELMVDKLLSKTNEFLEKLSGRYYVRSTPSKLGLALEIEDTQQQNIRRLPQTLSGGESFLVGLALALAMADIANNGKAIDSLFLDEGFGNLDADSLYLAMTTLENLRTHGKTVGIISHVEGVKKRIKTQIAFSKKADGLSELTLVA